MIDMTYAPDVDALYIYVGKGTFDHTEEAGPFIYDVDTEGRILGIEIPSVSQVLAPGAWQKRSPAWNTESGRCGIKAVGKVDISRAAFMEALKMGDSRGVKSLGAPPQLKVKLKPAPPPMSPSATLAVALSFTRPPSAV